MTRKDYRAIGAVLHEFGFGKNGNSTGHTVLVLADRIADVFAKDNPAFDRDRFLRFVETGREGRAS